MNKLITKYFYFFLLSGSSLLYSQNYSLSFNGQDDYVSIADNQSLTSTSMMTISAWFKKVSDPGWMSLVGKGTSDANEEYILMLKDDQVYFDVGQGGGPYLQQNTTIDSETWHHIAAVHTRSNGISTLKVYLNGEDVGGTTIGATSTPNDNSHTLTIGSRFSTPNALFKGQIDDVRIWNDALVGQQIQEIMYNNLSGYEDELIGYWDFNEGEGSFLTDLSGNDNDGMISGAGWSSDNPGPNVIYVPGNYSTIQEGIDASSDRDTVKVSSGTYAENINFNGKNIIVIGEDKINTIIDGNESGSVVTMNSGESTQAVLEEFTITNGLAYPKGGGVYISNASAQLNNLIIKDNISDPSGQGGSGGGIMVEYSNSTIIKYVCIQNNLGIQGGGIFIDHNSNVELINCTITDNSAESGGGITMYNSTLSLINNIVWGNNSNNNQQLNLDGSTSIIFSDIEGLPSSYIGNGNIDLDPLFVDPENNDFTLQSSSPCIDVGDPLSDNDDDGSVADMGAYPFIINEQSSPNHSLFFDGVGDYVVSSNANYDFTNGGSVHFNVKSNQIDMDNHKYILSQYSYPNGNYSAFELSIYQGYLNWHIRDNGGNNVGNVFDQIFLADDQWHEVFLVFDASNNRVRVTVDGVSNISDVSNLGNINSVAPFYLGRQHYHGHYFNGLISSATVWDEVIDINSINDYDNSRIFYYDINEGSGSVLTDLSGNGNDGMIYGPVWSDDAPVSSQDPSSVTFIKEADADYSLPENQDRITENIWITRGSSGWLYNAKVEDYNNDESPAGVLWAFGSTSSHDSGTNYDYLKSTVTANLGDDEDYYGGYYGYGGGFSSLEGETLSMYIAEIDQYYDVTFNTWGIGNEGNGGAVSYTRVPVEAPGDEEPEAPGTIMFTLEDGADFTLPENQDRITDEVWITRGSREPLFNAAVEDGYNDGSPTGTEWAEGSTSEKSPEDYGTLYDIVDEAFSSIADDGKTFSMHIIGTDKYFDITFQDWTSGCDGENEDNEACGFSYTRVPIAINEEPSTNYSLSFDGVDDYVLLGSPQALEFYNNDFTFSTWFKTSTTKKQWLISNYITYGNIPEWSFGIPNNSMPNNLGFDIRGGGGPGEIETDADVVDSDWHQVFLVKQNNSITIYLDGSEVFNDTYGDMNLTNGNPYFIGKQSENHGNYWDGFIDQMAFWNKALDHSEVLALNSHNSNTTNLISGFENYESSENLVALYTFDDGEGSTLTDLSGNGNDGIIYGATWSDDVPVLPVYGCTDSYALNFNSDANADDGSCYYPEDGNNYSLDFGGDVDYVELSATDNFDFSDEQQLTISAYVKALGNNEVIFQAEESFGYYIGTHNEGGFALTMYFDGYEDLCVSSTDITDGNWHHVVGAYDGSSIKIYVDGELENTCDAGVLVSQDQSSLITIGAYRAGESNYQWNGSIDELNIWNASLSDDDVVGLLSADTIISSDNLIANYKFNSGSGDILFDHSGNANHGQINEATWADGFRMPSSQVTFLVNMREFAEDDVLSEGVYISGGNIGSLAGSIDDQTGFQMFDDDGDHVYEVTLNLDRNSFYTYKFRIGLTDGNWQGNWEGIPQDCGYGEWFDRSLNTSSAGSQIVGPYCFGSCDNCEVPNMSLSFDGVDDYVEIPDSEILDGMSQMTIQFYMKWNSYPYQSYGKGVQVLEKWETANSNATGSYSFYTHHDADMLTYMVQTENNQLGVNIDLSANMSLGVWYQVTGVYDGQYSSLYLNGILQGEVEMSGNVASTPFSLELANQGNVNSTFFDGSIDEVIIWDIALSQEQIQSNMYVDLSGNETGLVGYWNFNDGEGSTLTDYSGNGNHGSIYSATWSDDFPIPPHAGPQWFVDEDGSDDNNGSYDYPFSTIQHAINSSSNGDSIFVSSGTYYENINFYGKEVKVFGLSGPEETIIDGQAMNSAVVAFRDFDYSDAGIYGFTIQNAEYGVMVLNGGSPEIKWCIVRDITLGGDGGFYLAGDGIGSSPTVSECLIYGNESNSGEGGGIRVASNNGNSSALIINCTIVGNSPEGIRVHGSNTVVDVVNTIIYDNPTSITNLGTINITNSNVQGGFAGDGNFDDDPQFCNPVVGDYLLSESSSSLFYVEDSLSVGFYNDPGCEFAYTNYALSLDGDDDQIELEPSYLDGLSEFTFQAMFFANQEQSGISNIIQHDGPSSDFYLRYEGNGFTAFQKNSDSEYGVINMDAPSSNVWHQITFTYDGSTSRLYLDGNEQGSFDLTGTYVSNETIYLGNWEQREGFNGAIDEVSLFDYALTQEEVLDYSNRALSGLENGILAHFNFNEGDGNTLTDVTGSGNNGIIIDGSWVNGAPLNAPEPPEPEITAVNVEIDNNNVSFSFEADTSGLGFFDVQWVLGSDTVMSYQGNSAQDLRPGLHYVRAGLIDQSGELRGDEVLQSFYILNGYEQYYYTDFEDTVDTGLPAGWGSYSNGQGWYVSDDPYFEYWTTEPGVGSVAISNDDAADNDGENDFNDGSQDYLYLPPLDFTSFSTPVALEFGSFFTGQWSQTAHVTYTTDGGSSWQTLADIEPSWKWERQYFDLSFLQGYENVSISFHSNDNNDWGSGLIIDDVSIIENYTLPTSFITGYVYSSNGDNPLIGASIIAVEENNYFDHQTISDSTGYYSLELISGTNYYLNTSLSDYQDNVQYVSVSDDSLYLNIYLDDFQEVQDAIVEGNVINWYTNESVPNASVLFVYSDDEMQTIELSTDNSGYFMAQVPSQKDYDLFVYADGYWVEHDAFYLNENDHQVLSVGIAEMSNASRLYGTIRDDETNELIPYAEVYLNCDQASDWDRTGQLGTYRLFNYYPGDCDNGVLVVNAQGYETSLQSVSNIEFEIGASINKDISLSQGNNPEPGMLSGTIISNIDDNQIHGAILKAFSINSGLLYETFTDSGYFSFTLPESEYTVSINADGHQEKLESIYVHSGSQLDTVIYLDEIYSNIFYGLVRDNDGNLIDGAIITAHFEVDNISSEISTISNTDGSYQLIVPDGTFDLAVSRTGYQISWIYDVSILESNIEQDFTLDQIGSFDGALMGSVHFFGNLSGTATINIWNDTYFAEAVTAENGTFYIDLINGTYSIFAAANGYTSVVIPDAITIQDNVVNYDIHFSQPGFVEPPVISSLSDVPNDQGRKLDMSWLPGDPQDFENFTQYSIWRKITNLPTGSLELWHYIATEDYIQGSDIYERSVPTLIDANPDTVNQSTFMVTAHTEDPFVFFDSPPFSGFSVDNLFPEVPSNISVSSSMADNSMYEVLLSWSEAVDEDFAFFNVYRSDINSDESAMVFQVVESTFTDVVSDWGNYEYWVTAVDHNGNESEPSEIAGIQLSVEEELIPGEFALSQNYPNPFNPSTQIRYALAENTKVTVTVYNMLGSKVRTLVNNYQDAGFKNVLWNATNDNGASVSAGMYIYTIQAGNFYQAKKMILLK